MLPNQLPPPKPNPDPLSVLILYKPVTDFHKKVVQTVANFIKTRCQCEVSYNNPTMIIITDAHAWVTDRLVTADKVIFIWSQDDNNDDDTERCNIILNNQDDVFSIGYRMMEETCRETDNGNKKWIVARMIYTPLCGDDLRPNSVPLFELHTQISDLCCYLQGNHHHEFADGDERVILQSELVNHLDDATGGRYSEASLFRPGRSVQSGESLPSNSSGAYRAAFDSLRIEEDATDHRWHGTTNNANGYIRL